jgi:16S rRNA (cytosine967-C5)-methyltransferase
MRSIHLADFMAELLRETRHGNFPSDRVLRRFVHKRRQLGSRERVLLGDTYYHLLRHLLRIDEAIRAGFDSVPLAAYTQASSGFPVGDALGAPAWATPADLKDIPWPRLDRWLDQVRGALAAEELKPGLLEEVIPELVKHWPARVEEISEGRLRRHLIRSGEIAAQFAAETKPVRFPLKHSFPEWLWGQVGFGLPPRELDEAMAALNTSGSACVRVNTLLATVEDVMKQCAASNVEVRRSEIASDCLIADKRIPQGRVPALDDGKATFQDEGSQLLSEIVAAAPGQTVIDACAGAGGKTLHMGALMENRGRLLVYDVSANRFANLFDRAKSAGVTIVERLEECPRQPAAADLVVLDVPCSGTGTIRRSPELKWRLTREIVQERLAVQRRLLDEWSVHVRPGGRLAYMTCSLLADENGSQIDAFIARRPEFARVPLDESLAVRRDMLTRSGDVQLYPHRHGTDGFFLSVLARSG